MRCALLVLSLVILRSASAENSFDARIVDHVGLEYPCGGELRPVLMIVNDGIIAMSGCVVETWKNGFMVGSFDWELAIPSVQGEVRQPSFPLVDVVPGDLVEMRIISVNGVPDEEAEGNILAFQVEAEPPVANSFVVEVRTLAGSEPGEVSWSIVDRAAMVVASGGPYSVSEGEEVSAWVELQASECYNLVVHDAGGNGFAGGQVELISEATPLITTHGDEVLSELRSGFTTGLVSSVPRNGQDARSRIHPVPSTGPFFVETLDLANGPAFLEIIDAAGRVVNRSMVQGGSEEQFIDPGMLQTGTYLVSVLDGAGRRSRATLLIGR